MVSESSVYPRKLPKALTLTFLACFAIAAGFFVGTERDIAPYLFSKPLERDVVIYGATPSGLSAAMAASREGRSVLVIEPGRWIGGMITGGLSATDKGIEHTLGGLALEYFRRIGRAYGLDEEVWSFEPSVATRVYDEMLKEFSVEVLRENPLRSVRQEGNKIIGLRVGGGQRIYGKVFIDATYEGDLMAMAGVSYRVGREGTNEYGEAFAGVLPFEKNSNQFHFDIPALHTNGVLHRGVRQGPLPAVGTADEGVQAYCYRLILTRNPTNRIPIEPPERYNPDDFALLREYFKAARRGIRGFLHFHNKLPNGKACLNSKGALSLDVIGANWDYPDASLKRREELIQDHIYYTKGLLWFFCSDPAVPPNVRESLRQWGYCKDEFVDNRGFPHQLYVREARRMVGCYVMTEQDILRKREKNDSIGMGSNYIESHHVQRYADTNGFVRNEGFLYDKSDGRRPYDIPYRAVLPKKEECANLLVPVCLSASHLAYSSIRMEPVYMVLGESCGIAAAMAIERQSNVHEVPVPDLQEKLRRAGQVLGMDHPELLGNITRSADPE